jgi:hypothetical protein
MNINNSSEKSIKNTAAIGELMYFGGLCLYFLYVVVGPARV